MTENKSAKGRVKGAIYQGPARPGDRVSRPDAPVEFQSLPRRGLDDPARYWPHPDVKAAVNTALLLGLPLLVTGEPGCGKTQLGEAVAYVLGLDHERFETKSTSQARDVLYVYDVVGRFHAKDAKLGDATADARYFIEYTALGRAILLAHEAKDVKDLMPTGPHSLRHPGTPRRSVVVIDEIDKASRDFPNDLLNELDRMYFRVPELGAVGIQGTPGARGAGRQLPANLRPIVIFTSNSEKKLPDAFLRRCVYAHVREPEGAALEAIVTARLAEAWAALGLETSSERRAIAIDDALDFYAELRRPQAGLAKRPGMAELLNWLHALAGQGLDPGTSLTTDAHIPLVLATLNTLCKTSDDLARARPSAPEQEDGLFYAWVTRARARPTPTAPAT